MDSIIISGIEQKFNKNVLQTKKMCVTMSIEFRNIEPSRMKGGGYMRPCKKSPKVAYPHDYSKLRGRIIERYGKYYAFADDLGISAHTLSERLNNQSAWSHDDMSRAISLLGILDSEVGAYFFTPLVQKF